MCVLTSPVLGRTPASWSVSPGPSSGSPGLASPPAGRRSEPGKTKTEKIFNDDGRHKKKQIWTSFSNIFYGCSHQDLTPAVFRTKQQSCGNTQKKMELTHSVDKIKPQANPKPQGGYKHLISIKRDDEKLKPNQQRSESEPTRQNHFSSQLLWSLAAIIGLDDPLCSYFLWLSNSPSRRSLKFHRL